MHDNGIAHRDLKLQNILVVGDKPTDLRISDFGLSRFISPSGLMGTACGSPEYVGMKIYAIFHPHSQRLKFCRIVLIVKDVIYGVLALLPMHCKFKNFSEH